MSLRAARLIAPVVPVLVAACGEVARPTPEPLAEETSAVDVGAELSDAAYLVRLGLMRGHLLVGHELYGLGALDAARTHSKHPTDELYADMDNEFAARGTTGFAARLEAHATASQGDDAAAVGGAYTALTAAIGTREAAVSPSAPMIAEVVVELLREAAKEYAIGVVDGRLANAHEYQDAYGFTQVALAWAVRGGETDAAVFAPIAERIRSLADMWPGLAPPDEVGIPRPGSANGLPPARDSQAARLYGAAAEVEIHALALSDP